MLSSFQSENTPHLVTSQNSRMISKLEAQEEEMTEQLKRLEELTGNKLHRVSKEHELVKQSWRTPFMIMAGLMLLFVFYAYSKCQKIRASKLL